MLKFTDLHQNYPEKVESQDRKTNFNEIYKGYVKDKAEEQSSRCSQCGVPYCTVHCPLHNHIPDWLKLTAEDRLEEAYQLSASTNNLPEITGRICPQDRLCEGNCVIEQSGHGSVTIGSIEKYLTDNAFENNWIKPIQLERHQKRNESVGIIGSGPAGLAAADELRKKGYEITIYDRYDRAGGLLIYGIPNFKLEKNIVERRIKYLEDSGIKFHLNVNIGKDISFQEIRKKHEAILIATGVYKPRKLDVKTNYPNIHPALDFLTASNKKGLGDNVELFDDGTLNAEGKDVIVIGGGDTAMDCVRTSVRQNAKSVKCLYRRDRENMPGSTREVLNAEEEGVEFIWQSIPKSFHGDSKIKEVICAKTKLSEPDASGRQVPIEIENSEFSLKADIVIEALGFDPEDLPKLFNEKELPVTKWGTIKTSFSTLMTEMDGVFAAGDIARGASLVVWGIRDGRDAAESMHNYVEAKNQEIVKAS
jgi:glutamate synthase (NADPH/NADH) small chain